MFSPTQIPHWPTHMSRKSSHASASRCLTSRGVRVSRRRASAETVSIQIGPRPSFPSASGGYADMKQEPLPDHMEDSHPACPCYEPCTVHRKHWSPVI